MDRTRSAEQRAQQLLERMRETPMRRGALPSQACQLKQEIVAGICTEDVPPTLAERVALQCVLKFPRHELYDELEWRAAGQLLRHEITLLQQRAGMRMPRIITALPKLSAAQIVDFLDELTKTDARIARTILHAALNASQPLVIGRRYLADYRLVARKLRAFEPAAARAIAATSFTAGAPLHKAMEHVRLRLGAMR